VSESELVFGFSSSQFRPGIAAFCDLRDGWQQEIGRWKIGGVRCRYRSDVLQLTRWWRAALGF